MYSFWTPYGRRRIERRTGDVLQPELMSLEKLEAQRRGMTDYNFAAQYQQDPQPPAGIIVKRNWLRFYGPEEKPYRFDQILQSWDTANKDTELANFSVCTTWGIKDQILYLLDVFRQKLEFPALRRMILELAALHHAHIVLIEDKASGTGLIQDLRAASFSKVQAAPALDGNKVMRLRAQTAKIEGGFARFPEKAPWLDEYLRELTSFPNSRYDDQVDSTVFALAWLSANPEPNILRYYALRSAGWTDAEIAAGRHLAAERDAHSAPVEFSKRELGERETLCRWCNKPLHDDPDRRETDGEYIYHEDCYRLAGSPVGPLARENTICIKCGQLVRRSHCTWDQEGVYHVECYGSKSRGR